MSLGLKVICNICAVKPHVHFSNVMFDYPKFVAEIGQFKVLFFFFTFSQVPCACSFLSPAPSPLTRKTGMTASTGSSSLNEIRVTHYYWCPMRSSGSRPTLTTCSWHSAPRIPVVMPPHPEKTPHVRDDARQVFLTWRPRRGVRRARAQSGLGPPLRGSAHTPVSWVLAHCPGHCRRVHAGRRP